MNKYRYFKEMSWMAGVSSAEWEIFLNEAWSEMDEQDIAAYQAVSTRFILTTFGICLLLAALVVWAIFSIA
ncbi:MAG: hypothetical protein ACE5E7_07380 [Anaerolineae bacterium]